MEDLDPKRATVILISLEDGDFIRSFREGRENRRRRAQARKIEKCARRIVKKTVQVNAL
jgi:hypothetical protein